MTITEGSEELTDQAVTFTVTKGEISATNIKMTATLTASSTTAITVTLAPEIKFGTPTAAVVSGLTYTWPESISVVASTVTPDDGSGNAGTAESDVELTLTKTGTPTTEATYTYEVDSSTYSNGWNQAAEGLTLQAITGFSIAASDNLKGATVTFPVASSPFGAVDVTVDVTATGAIGYVQK